MARNPQQNEKMREERTLQIRKAALRLFASKGLAATKMRDIAEAVGMAQGLMYHYYSSKDSIYQELILDALDKMNAAVFYLRDVAASPHQKIEMAVEKILETIRDSEDFVQTCKLIAGAVGSVEFPEDVKADIDMKREIPYSEVSKIFAAGQCEGTIREGDPDQLAILFWTIINGLAIYRATRKEAVLLPEARLITGMFITEKGLME